MKITFNGTDKVFRSIEELSEALDRLNEEPELELWISAREDLEEDGTIGDGPSMVMPRNGEHAWLMYLRFAGESGFVPQSDSDLEWHLLVSDRKRPRRQVSAVLVRPG